MDTVEHQLPPAGHNHPPPDLRVGEALREELRGKHDAVVGRKDELLAMADRFDADHPEITSDEASGLLAGVIAQMNGHAKIADKTREGVKAPYLEGTRIVDGFFIAGIIDPLTKRAKLLNQKQTTYQTAKAERQRREAEARERQAREEEERRRREAYEAEQKRLAAEAQARATTGDLDAFDAEKEAAEAKAKADAAREAEARAAAERQQQAKMATASNAELSRVRGDYAMSSLRTTWKFRVVDIAKVPPQFLVVNESLVNAAIRGKNGVRQIPGLDVYEHKESVNR